MAVHAELENLGWSIVRSLPGESSPKQAAKAGGWVSGEEFYTYVQPGGSGLTVFMWSYLELPSNSLSYPRESPCPPLILPAPLGLMLLAPIQAPPVLYPLPLESPSSPDTHFCSFGLSQILHRLTRRVLQLETVLEGVMTQVDAMSSKLTMVERKGWLAPPPGAVSGSSPGSSWLPTADLYHIFHSVDGGKTFLKDQHFRLLGQHVPSSQSVSGGQVGGRKN